MTVVTKESYSSIQDHDERLKAVIMDACDDLGIPDGIRNEIVEQGILRFVIDKDNNVRSISTWSNIGEFVSSFKDKIDNETDKKRRTAKELAEQREIKKQELYDLLCHYAKIGDMKSYRAARLEYSKL